MTLYKIVRRDYDTAGIDFTVATIKLGIAPGKGKDVISVGPVRQAQIRKINSVRGYQQICKKDWGPSQGMSHGMLRLNVVAYALNVVEVLEIKQVGKKYYGRIRTIDYWTGQQVFYASESPVVHRVTFQKRNGKFAAHGDPPDELDHVFVPLLAKKPCWIDLDLCQKW